MAPQEKLKKGFMYFYKSGTRKQKQKREPMISANKIVSQSHSLKKKLENFEDIETDVELTNKPSVAVLSYSHNSLQKKLESCQEIEPSVATTNKLSKRLENYQEIEHGGRRGAGTGNLIEGRKSVSHVETNLLTNLASVISFLQVNVLVSDMPGFMQVHAFRCARRTYDSLEKFSSKHIAYNIKKEFDKVYGPAWHCIVGSGFGSYVTHSTGCFLYFSMEKLYILVFKTKVQKACS